MGRETDLLARERGLGAKILEIIVPFLPGKGRSQVEGVNMSENVFALLVHDRPEPFESLRQTLRKLSVETYSVNTCKEAAEIIGHCRPHIIFTASAVGDGSWASLLDLAEAANVHLDVIVVAAAPDTQLYISVMERGAFDFVAPPFEVTPLQFVVRSAELDVRLRRAATSLAAAAQGSA